MRFLRLLFRCLALTIAVAVLFVGAALLPPLQTWAANWALPRYAGVNAAAESWSVGFSAVEATDLRVELDGGFLTLPHLEAGLAVKTVVWDRKFPVGRLVAKGWTLDLTGRPGSGKETVRTRVAVPSAAETPVPSQNVARAFSGLLSQWQLPGDLSLDGVDLEGDVVIAIPSEKEPVRVHVIIKGGGLAANRPGNFTIHATHPTTRSRSKPPIPALAAQGRLAIELGRMRRVDRVTFNGHLSAPGSSLPEDLTLTAGIATTDGNTQEAYTVELSRGDRPLVNVVAAFPFQTKRFAGTWKLDLKDGDLAPLNADRRPHLTAAAGEGRFDADAALAEVHTAGRLKVAGNRWEQFAPRLKPRGDLAAEAEFDFTHRTHSLQIDQLNLSLAGNGPIAVVHSLQSFSVDEMTGEVTPADVGSDWLRGSLQGFPLAWLPSMAGGLSLAGGDATGDFVINKSTAGIGFRSTAPLVATGVSIQRAGRTLGQNMDLSLSLLADYTSKQGWQFQAAPLSANRAGRRLATLEAKVASTTRADQALLVTGNWTANLAAVASPNLLTEGSGIEGQSASGEFTAYVGTSADVRGKIKMTGPDPAQVITTSGHAFFGADGGITFQVLNQVATGPNESEFSADGAWISGKSEPRLDLDLTAVKVSLDHLSLFASQFPLPVGAKLPALLTAGSDGAQRSSQMRDQRPFWADLIGSVRFNFYQLLVGHQEWNEVAGTLALDPTSVRLENGRGALAPPRLEVEKAASSRSGTKASTPRGGTKPEAPRSMATAQGSLRFDPAAALPYQMMATVTLDPIEWARVLETPSTEKTPLIEGRCVVAGTLKGDGITLEDLLARRQEEITFTSKGGILRLLKTTAAQSISEVPTPVMDALAPIGSAVGFLLGIKEGAPKAGKSPYSKTAEAVLEFTPQVAEIRYDQLTFTAVRGADRTVRLASIALSAANECLTGSGQIDYVKDRPIRSQPIHLDFQLGVRGPPSAKLATAGLLSAEKNSEGYTLLKQPIHFGGTLEQIDESQWREMLVRAAAQPPPRGGKGG